MATWTLEHFTI